jgi:hypothetical protein
MKSQLTNKDCQNANRINAIEKRRFNLQFVLSMRAIMSNGF